MYVYGNWIHVICIYVSIYKIFTQYSKALSGSRNIRKHLIHIWSSQFTLHKNSREVFNIVYNVHICTIIAKNWLVLLFFI